MQDLDFRSRMLEAFFLDVGRSWRHGDRYDDNDIFSCEANDQRDLKGMRYGQSHELLPMKNTRCSRESADRCG
jgi:hypothetical protein